MILPEEDNRRNMRVTDRVGGVPDIERVISDYEQYYREVPGYRDDLNRLIAGYSRGDSAKELRTAYEFAVQKVLAADPKMQAKYGEGVHVFTHRGNAAEIFRNEIVLLSFGLCLRGSREDAATLLQCGERGDPILEVLARACASGLEVEAGAPAYPKPFDGLYDATTAPEKALAECIATYLQSWYDVKMEGFSFKGNHLVENSGYAGYWCVEAAGMVVALGIDDRTFADHPLYPRDLVAFFRASGKGR